jgi:hypothetical protein
VIVRKPGGRWLPVRIDDFEAWQTRLLEESAYRFGAVLSGADRVHRWGSVGAPVELCGQRAWLRVSPYLEHEMDETAWRGTRDAAAIPGVCKPSLIKHIEWSTSDPVHVPVSAEVLALVADQPASRDRFLYQVPEFSPSWYSDLAASLSALAGYPTDRRFRVHEQTQYDYLLSATYRRSVPVGTTAEFGTEHLDLSWENVSAPGFQILDMEHWGVGVRGYGAAYLYLTSFAVPQVAERVHEALADVLDSPSGRYAQLVAAALIIRNLTRLPDPTGLAATLHRYTDALLDGTRSHRLDPWRRT